MNHLNLGRSVKINKPATKKIIKAIQFAVKSQKQINHFEKLKVLSTLSDAKLAEESAKLGHDEKKRLISIIDDLDNIKKYLK